MTHNYHDMYKDRIMLCKSLIDMADKPSSFVDGIYNYNCYETINGEISKLSEDQILTLIKKHFTTISFLSNKQKTDVVVQLHKMLWEI